MVVIYFIYFVQYVVLLFLFFIIFDRKKSNEDIMQVTTYSTFRQNLKRYFDSVVSSRSPLYVKRSTGEDIVVLANSDYESMQETLYLLSNPNNAQRIADALEEYNNGKGQVKTLIEE